MIGDVARVSLGSEADEVFHPRKIISLKNEPIEKGEFPCNNPFLKYTNFTYYMKYYPNSKVPGREKKNFLIKADILRGTLLRVESLKELCEKSKEDIAVSWLLRWTNIKDGEFWDIVKKNIFVDFPLYFDCVGYTKEIKSKFPQAGRNYPVFFERRRAMEIAKEFDTYYKDKLKEGEKTIYDD